MKVKLARVRLAFPALFEARTVPGSDGDPKFSGSFVIVPGSENAKALAAALVAVAKDKWKDKADGILKKLKDEGRVCFQEKPKTNSSGEVYQGFEGNYFLNASNSARPLVLDRNKSPIGAADGRIYGGCYVNATVELWAQDNNFGKRINASLKGVQFVEDGDSFGGGTPGSADDFDELGVPENAAADLC